ncbi:hypothetical protein Pelo_16590 [Pelomyxa schiedti]|nr:hypothetical protein Pelo_16590 [Pelomyxa schiedti]
MRDSFENSTANIYRPASLCDLAPQCCTRPMKQAGPKTAAATNPVPAKVPSEIKYNPDVELQWERARCEHHTNLKDQDCCRRTAAAATLATMAAREEAAAQLAAAQEACVAAASMTAAAQDASAEAEAAGLRGELAKTAGQLDIANAELAAMRRMVDEMSKQISDLGERLAESEGCCDMEKITTLENKLEKATGEMLGSVSQAEHEKLVEAQTGNQHLVKELEEVKKHTIHDESKRKKRRVSHVSAYVASESQKAANSLLLSMPPTGFTEGSSSEATARVTSFHAPEKTGKFTFSLKVEEPALLFYLRYQNHSLDLQAKSLKEKHKYEVKAFSKTDEAETPASATGLMKTIWTQGPIYDASGTLSFTVNMIY